MNCGLENPGRRRKEEEEEEPPVEKAEIVEMANKEKPQRQHKQQQIYGRGSQGIFLQTFTHTQFAFIYIDIKSRPFDHWDPPLHQPCHVIPFAESTAWISACFSSLLLLCFRRVPAGPYT